MLTYWLFATGALLASVAVGFVVPARFRLILAIAVAIVCLVLLTPATCSSGMSFETVVSPGGSPGPVTQHVSLRCFTIFDVETSLPWAGALPGVLFAVTAGVLVVYAGRLGERRRRRSYAEPAR